MANTKITTGNIADGSITSAKLDTSSLAIPSTATATTQTAGDNSTAIATTAYVETAVSNLVDSSPAALDTLNELAAALGDDANFSTTVTNSLALKAPLASPSFTGNVGIGTSSPSKKFVVSEGGAHGFEISPYDGSQNATRLINYNRNTSAYFPLEIEASQIAFEIDGTEKVRIDSSGNVGIGKTPNRSRKLEVAGTMNLDDGSEYEWGDGSISIAGNSSTDVMTFATASTERMRIDSSGNLFLNTTSAMDACFVQLTDHSNGEAFLGISSKDDNNVGIRFGVGTTRKWINYRDTSNNLVWYDNAAAAERMRIHSSGDVSIGSSGTVYKNISSSQSPTLSIDGTFPAINFKDDSGTGAFYGINGSRMYLGGGPSTVDLLFYLNDAAVTKITDAGIVSTNCSTNYKGVHIHGSQAPCISFAKNTADETSPEWRIGVSGYDGSDLAISVGSTTGDRVRIDPNGRLLAGIENVAPRAGNTNVGNEAIQSYGPIISGAFQGSYTGGLHCIRDWFVYAGPSTNTGTYLHIKTDLPNSTANSSYTMSLFKYRAYCYGGGGNVAEGLLGWHNWSGGYYNVGIVNYNSSWALVQSSYTSSDNYVVLVAYLPASYCHLAIDWDQWGGYPFRTAKVTATTQTSSSTGAY